MGIDGLNLLFFSLPLVGRAGVGVAQTYPLKERFFSNLTA